MVQFNLSDKNNFQKFAPAPGKGGGGKSLSLADVQAFVLRFRAEVAVACCVALAVASSWWLLSSAFQEAAGLDGHIQEMTGKEPSIADLEKVRKDDRELTEGIPPGLPANQFIAEISALAGRRNISVETMSPPKTAVDGFLQKTTIQLTCQARGFRDILFFLHDIENGSHTLKVDAWSVSANSGDDPGAVGSPSGIRLALTLSSVEIGRNEKK